MIHGSKVSNAYTNLLVRYQPRPVTTERQAEEYQHVIDSFIDKREQLSEDERQFMALLGELISAWEDDKFELSSISGVELARHLLLANNL